jgi:hypothetical protein
LEENGIFTYAYLTVITATTVGYGDIGPLTHQSRLLAVCIMFQGSILIALIVNVAKHYIMITNNKEMTTYDLIKKIIYPDEGHNPHAESEFSRVSYTNWIHKYLRAKEGKHMDMNDDHVKNSAETIMQYDKR